MDADAAIFVAEATAAVVSAVVAISHRETRTSVVALAVMVVAVVSVFVSLGALPAAAVQLLVYAGAVALLLGTDHGTGVVPPRNGGRPRLGLAALLIAIPAIGLLAVAIVREVPPTPPASAHDAVEALATLLFGRYAIALAAAAALVATALLAVVARARSAGESSAGR